MYNEIGKTEGASAVVLSMLPVYIYKSLGDGISNINGAFWINFLLTSLVVYVILLITKNGFIFFKNNRNTVVNGLFNALFLVYIFSYSIYILCLGTDVLKILLPGSFSFDVILYFTIFSSCVCALCGAEALTRTAYIMFHLLCVIIIIMCVISFRGWTFVNYTPVLGNDIMKTFFSGCSRFIPFTGLVSVFYLGNYFKNATTAYLALKGAYRRFFLISFSVAILCIFCTPYPMISYYPFSLSAVFSLAESGAFFHSFEIFLISFVVIINIMSLSYSIYMSASCICKLTLLCDYKPFIPLLGLLFYSIAILFDIKTVMLGIYLSASCALIVLFVFFSIFQLVGRKNETH